MTEREKMLAGQLYDCGDKELLAEWHRAKDLARDYNNTDSSNKEEKERILNLLLGGRGENLWITAPFYVDYGNNIYFGNNCEVNMNCTFVDCNRIDIGSNVLIASNVQLYTATHPVELSQRLTPDWNPESREYFCRTYARPIKIGNGCWLGGGVIVLPGVTIGDGCVIGGGSVVTKDIPPNSLAVGNPCRVIRKINEEARNGSIPEPL